MSLAVIAYGTFFLTTALAFAIVCLGLNLQWGMTGLFNVGVAGFVAVGAYASAILTTPPSPMHLGGFGLPIPVGWIGGALLAGLASLAVGAITLRLRADYLAITTFGIAVAIHLVVLNVQVLTGGPFGVGFIPRLFEGVADQPLKFGLGNLVVTVATCLAVYGAMERLAVSPWGRVLRAIREDEAAAQSLGKNATRYRLQAFTIGGAIMGLGGALHAHYIGFIAPNNYLPNFTFQVWTMLIIGGSGNNRGAIAGAVIVWSLWSLSGAAISLMVPPQMQARASALQLAAIGVILCVVLLVRPRGLIGERQRSARPTTSSD
jgi:branched-chain amino acid transport system permease protein